MSLIASYIKCHADKEGCRVYEVDDARFTTPVPMLAASLRDAEIEVAECSTDEICTALGKNIQRVTPKMIDCPTCGGLGEIEEGR